MLLTRIWPIEGMDNCLACGDPIKGKRHVIRLKITQEEPRLTKRAKELGFTSPTWKAGDYLEGPFDASYFDVAKLMWQIAFHTRLLSPRR